jgi:hypothetical protein
MALLQAVLDVQARVSSTFTFCTSFDHSLKTCDFEVTESRDTALAFLLETAFLEGPQAALLITLGLIFAAGRHTRLELPREPYVEKDQFGVLAFVLLLLNGADDEQELARLKKNGFVSSAQKDIGIKVLRSGNAALRGTWLNPGARFFVCHVVNHFITVVKVMQEGLQLMIYDTLRHGDVCMTAPEELNWV